MPHSRLRLPVLCVSLLVPAIARAQAPTAAPAPTAPEAEAQRRDAARALYSARRYREAALAYEALWRDTGAAKYRFNAGMAREAAEHHGAALLHWQAYLASGSASAEERRMLEQRVSSTRAQLQRVQIRVEGPLPGPATLRVSAPERAPQGPRDAIELPAQAELDLSLEPGAWSVALELPDGPVTAGFELIAGSASPTVTLTVPTPPVAVRPTPPPLAPAPVDLTLTLGPPRALARGVTLRWSGAPTAAAGATANASVQTLPRAATSPLRLRVPAGTRTLRAAASGFADQTLDFDLATTRQLDLQLRRDHVERTRLGLGLGLGGAALVLGSVGAGFIARGAGELADLRRAGALPDCGTPERCSAATRGVLQLSSGLALLGSGLGTGIVAGTAGLGARDRALKIEAGAGAALFVGGLIWYVAEIHGAYDLHDRARDHLAATVLGGGAGLLGAATISLVTRRLVHRRHRTHALTPALTPSSAGLLWHARF